MSRAEDPTPKSKLPLIAIGIAGGFLFLCLGCCGIFGLVISKPNVNRPTTSKNIQAKSDPQPKMDNPKEEGNQPVNKQPAEEISGKLGPKPNELPFPKPKGTFSQSEVTKLTDPEGRGGGAVAGSDIVKMLGKPDRIADDGDGGKIWFYYDKVTSDKDGHVYRTTVVYINKVGYCNLPAISIDTR